MRHSSRIRTCKAPAIPIKRKSEVERIIEDAESHLSHSPIEPLFEYAPLSHHAELRVLDSLLNSIEANVEALSEFSENTLDLDEALSSIYDFIFNVKVAIRKQ